MPYTVSAYGMEFSDILTHGTSVTKLYIEAAKINEKDRLRDAAAMMRRIAANPGGFTVIRVKFSNLLTSYYTTYRTIACDILHDFFSVPCGSSVPKTVPDDKLAAVHKMLNLQHGEALLDQAHPVCLEYAAEPGGGIRRVFPPGGNSMQQVFTKHNDAESHTAKFLAALCECCAFCSFAVLSDGVNLCCFVGR